MGQRSRIGVVPLPAPGKALVREGLDRTTDAEIYDPAVSVALNHLDAVRRTLIDRQAA